MGTTSTWTYFVFMNFDPEYERLRGYRTCCDDEYSTSAKQAELDMYLSMKHDKLLAELLEPNTYRKRLSLSIVDGFAVEITDQQADLLRSAMEVRIVEKNQELD